MPTFTQNPPDRLRLLPTGDLVLADGSPAAPYLAAFVADTGCKPETPVCIVSRAWIVELLHSRAELEALRARFALLS